MASINSLAMPVSANCECAICAIPLQPFDAATATRLHKAKQAAAQRHLLVSGYPRGAFLHGVLDMVAIL
jgi:hypothetical protein